MHSVLSASAAELLLFELVGSLLLVLSGAVIFAFALSAIQPNDDSHIRTPLNSNRERDF
jgi:hypothetical protein